MIILSGKLVYAVTGPTSQLLPVQGLTIDPQTETVIDHWAPEEVSILTFLTSFFSHQYCINRNCSSILRNSDFNTTFKCPMQETT